MPRRNDAPLVDQKRKTTMPFGKKFAEKFGTDKKIKVSVANIEDAITAALYGMRLIPENTDVFQINWNDLVNKKPTDVITVGLKVRKN